MLVLSRKSGERVWIGDQIAVTILQISGGSVRVGIDAPTDVPIVREEIRVAYPPEEHRPRRRRRPTDQQVRTRNAS